MTILNLVLSIFLLIVLSWVAIFGGVGGLLARARGGSAAAGVAWGVVLGPFGWLGVVWTTRTSVQDARATAALVAVQDTDWIGGSWDD